MSFISKDHFNMALQGIKRLINQISKNIVQSDWNETDKASNAYIQNKPFEEREFEYTFVDLEKAPVSGQVSATLNTECEYDLIPGNIYKVIINGVEKEIECTINNGYSCLILNDYGNFYQGSIFQIADDIISGWSNWESGSSIKVIGKTRSVKKLDEKFIPDTVVRESDIASTDKYGITKLSNVINQYDYTTAASTYAVTRVYAASLLKSGGTMTGDLTLKGDPTSKLHAATKQYVDNKALLKSGGTMTGALTLKGDPTSNLHAATKQYVDNKALPKSGGTMTGNLTLAGDPTSNLHAATKQYVDNAVKNLDIPEQVQADWNQKDETGKSFIKNRTHWEFYEPAVSILDETTFTTSHGMPPGSYAYIDGSFLQDVRTDIKYEIIVDGKVYSQYLRSWYSFGEFFGNVALFNDSYTNTGDDFLIFEDSSTIGFYHKEAGSHTVTIRIPEKYEIHTLDEKFIPDTIARKSDIPGAVIKSQIATVGQTIVVSKVDSDGKPVEWEYVDPWVLIDQKTSIRYRLSVIDGKLTMDIVESEV